MLYHFSPCSFPQRLSSYWKYAGYKNCLGFGWCLSIEVCVVTEWDAVTFCCLSQPHFFPFPRSLWNWFTCMVNQVRELALALRKTSCSSGCLHKCCCGLRRVNSNVLPWSEEILRLQQQFRLWTASLGLVLKWLKKIWGRTYLLQLHARFCARLKWGVVTLIWKVSKTEINFSKVKSSDSQELLVLGK